MKVTLLSRTEDALDLLLFTKQTRLTMSPEGMEEVRAWSVEKKMAELEKMRNTIQSSWEFVEYTFAIEGVTRAFTHQLVRQRIGTSFAQQSQRAVDMEGFEYLATGEALHPDGGTSSARPASRRDGRDLPGVDAIDNPSNAYDWTMQRIDEGYNRLMELDVPAQDARGVLPTNVLTNIVFKANLRTLHEMALKRLCVRTQGEFQDVFRKIVNVVVDEHHWADAFLRVQCAWNGTCLFPLIPNDQCHVKPYVYDPATGLTYGRMMMVPFPTTEEIYQIHRSKRATPQPPVSK